jgi:hypothetical protein
MGLREWKIPKNKTRSAGKGRITMKSRIVRFVLTAVGVVGLAAAPAAFGGDFRQDYRQLERRNADIRHDRAELHRDLEEGRYRRAARERADLNRDYRERERQVRDIRHDYYR